MDILYLLLIILPTYFLYEFWRKKHYLLKSVEKAIDNQYKGLMLFLETCSFTPEQAEEVKTCMEKFYETEKKYMSLREKYKDASKKQQFNICHDWLTYLQLTSAKIATGTPGWENFWKIIEKPGLNTQRLTGDLKLGKEALRITDNLKEIERRTIELEAIENRFNLLLSS